MGKKTNTASGTLANLKAGSLFTYGGIKWLLLEKAGGAALSLAHELLPETRAFDEKHNNFATSELKKWLNSFFLSELYEAGAAPDAFVEMTVDLTADDGLKDYGTTRATIALISCEQYRRFRHLIPNASNWWWTCTPYSTEKNGYSRYARIVITVGTLNYSRAFYGGNGVRPLCSLKSSILVSYEPDEVEAEAGETPEPPAEDAPEPEALPKTGLNALTIEIHKNALAHGWWNEPRSFPEILALIHSELSEALEEHRDGKPEIYFVAEREQDDGQIIPEIRTDWGDGSFDGEKPEGVAVELADAVIRILDYCGHEGIDIEAAILLKHTYNKTRPYRHGGKKC